MGDMLSQAEIDALLGNTDDTEEQETLSVPEEDLTEEQKDALGEIGNISMGTAATTLFTLVNQKVTITTPKVQVTTWEKLSRSYKRPCVAIKVEYKEGLKGANLLVLREEDVKIITDLMMGGDGSNLPDELSELHLSAISEAMNQMVGSASTSMSSILNQTIDIMPPDAFVLDLTQEIDENDVGFGQGGFVQISFKMEVGQLIDSEIMQLLPIDFAKNLFNNLIQAQSYEQEVTKEVQAIPVQEPKVSPVKMEEPPVMSKSVQQSYQQEMKSYATPTASPQQPVNVQPVQFQNFDMPSFVPHKENINLIMDVPLEVTVELGRSHKTIKEILEFSPGTIVELDKVAGEPVDILVNGKFIAKGEVVVIDENFGIRITDIIDEEHRI
ncbi:MAG: flagellar motor switch phosphatase FliY [Epulopiscium sp.]|nr:flagellar motor switch phosphatase FliY [Candidatus Epulonipiscium sp.]